MSTRKPHELRNIKITPEKHYQIQYIREGQSYSKYAKTLIEAMQKRDKLEQQLGIIPQTKTSTKRTKTSISPADQIMPVGISYHYATKRGHHYISVSWRRKPKGKPMTKAFYIGTDNTFTEERFTKTYQRAAEFRKDYEQAIKDGTLKEFNPKDYNLKNKTNLIKKHRIKNRLKRR